MESLQIIFSFLSVGWGLISDIDIESERLRMIGYQRFTIWTLHRLVSLRTYHGTVSYMRATQLHPIGTSTAHSTTQIVGHNNQKVPTRPLMKHSMSCGNQLDCAECNGEGDCEACDTGFGDVLSLETNTGMPSPGFYRPRLDSWYSANSRKSTYYSTADSLYQSVAEKLSDGGRNGLDEPDAGHSKVPAQMYGPASNIPALTAPVPSDWTVEQGEFIMVHATYQTHISSDCFFAPLSQLNDGLIWLCVIRGGASRQDLLRFLMGMSNGTHLMQQNRFIEMIPVTAFRIEPETDVTSMAAEKKHGHFTVDGERVEYGPIQGEVMPGAARVMAPIYTT